MASLIDDMAKVKLEDTPILEDEKPKTQGYGTDKRKEEEEESEQEEIRAFMPFRFFDLPSEIRLRIYAIALFTARRKRALQSNGSVGASAKNPPRSPLAYRLNIFLVSRRIHDEASDYFYSSQVFRIFPIQDYSRLPTVRAIPSRYKPSIATIELILGSSWTSPPPSWKVNRHLGLEEMTRIRTLKVFIECDPSHPVFEGFRISKNFYSEFAGKLLAQILERLPSLEHVEFDGNPSVLKSGALMKRLLYEARAAKKKLAWGPQRGWTDYDGEEVVANTIVRGLDIPKLKVPTPNTSIAGKVK